MLRRRHCTVPNDADIFSPTYVMQAYLSQAQTFSFCVYITQFLKWSWFLLIPFRRISDFDTWIELFLFWKCNFCVSVSSLTVICVVYILCPWIIVAIVNVIDQYTLSNSVTVTPASTCWVWSVSTITKKRKTSLFCDCKKWL